MNMIRESALLIQGGSFGRSVLELLDKWMNSDQTVYPLLGAAAVTVGTMGLGLWIASARSGNGRIETIVDPEMQTRQLKDGSRVARCLKGDSFVSHLFDDARTLFEGARRGERISKNGPMLGYRKKLPDGSEPYHWLTYKEVIDRSINVAIAFRQLELASGQTTMIGVYSKNRPEWIIIEQATYAFSNVLVPLYDTLGADACAFIINQAEMRIVICDTDEKVTELLKQKTNCPSLQYIVVMQTANGDLHGAAEAAGIELITFDRLEEIGRAVENRPELMPPTPEDLATICYTSGTTGTPKGVMLTHASIIADCTTLDFFKHSMIVHEDVAFSFLPLAHMLERVVEAVCFMVGARVGFFRGDIRGLVDDIRELRPTVVPVVPRVLNRLYDRVIGEVNKSRLKRALFDVAVAFKKRELDNGIIRNNSIWDAMVFKRVREGMGGRVKLMITGSAPLSENVLTFVRAAMGCFVVEGYGQTECVAPCTVTIEGDNVPGHVGIPSPCCAIKLVDAPELGYFAHDQAGEVCVKGLNVFKGYYKSPEMTREVLDADGWLHTGDIGRWTPTGTLKIVDRKKHIFKLSQGEYVAPEKIENVYVRCRFVAQSFVYGESLKSCLVAVVVPDAEVLIPWAMKEFGLKEVNIQQLCSREDVKKVVLDEMVALGKKSGLFSFEQVRDIYLCAEPFSVENDLLTPTLKSKRPQLKQHFQPQLDAMYTHLD